MVEQVCRASVIAMLALSFVACNGVVSAGPLEDGEAAFSRGDYATAQRLWRVLAEQGDAKAQLRLGSMYESGKGVVQNYVEAARWLRLAAEQGNADAQSNLGAMYEKGRGVTQDYKEAVRLYRLAAPQGSKEAQQNLAAMYFFGMGITQDYVRALMWNEVAAAQKFGDAISSHDIFSGPMTTQQIAEAQVMARKCETSNYQQCD
jgi:TPR repeat protein